MIFGKIIGFAVGVLGVALAFGLSLLCAAYMFGSHLRLPHQPGRHDRALGAQAQTEDGACPCYIVAQIIGALLGGS